MQVDTALVRELAALLDATQLTEIEVQDGERRIRVVRSRRPPRSPMHPRRRRRMLRPQHRNSSAQRRDPTPQPAGDNFSSHPGAVKSPIVGTAYLTPEPGAAPFASVGQAVKAGDTLLIIEAMKVMNPITAPKAGKIVRILINNEAPVEYDEPLMVIE